MVLIEDSARVVWSAAAPHEGDFHAAAKRLLAEGKVKFGVKALVTGNEGRFMFNLTGTLELCTEAAQQSAHNLWCEQAQGDKWPRIGFHIAAKMVFRACA